MTTSISLDHLSLESDAVLGDDVRIDAAAEDELSNPIHGKDFDDVTLVLDTYNTLKSRKFVCRDDIRRIEPLRVLYPAIGQMLDEYPINSFTQEPSTINLDISNESFARSAYEAVMRALRDVIKFIVESFKRLWAFLTDSAQKTAAVDGVADNLDAIQKYIAAIDKVYSQRSLRKDYENAREGALKQTVNDANHMWNGMYEMFIDRPDEFQEILRNISQIVREMLPPFVKAVGECLTEITGAQSEAEVIAAVRKMEAMQMASPTLFALAAKYGYKANLERAGFSKISGFQARALFLRNTFKGQINQRPKIDAELFQKTLLTYVVTPWAGEINDTIKWSSSKTAPLLERISNFNEDSLQPGLQDVYAKELAPFFITLTSITQGFVVLEQSMGMLTTTRNQAVRLIGKSALTLAKVLDKVVMRDKDNLNLIDKSTLLNYRRALRETFEK